MNLIIMKQKKEINLMQLNTMMMQMMMMQGQDLGGHCCVNRMC